jgi:polar amino acid transport system substrate-binding protein
MAAMVRSIGFRRLLCATIAVALALNGRASPAEPLRIVTDPYLGPFKDINLDKSPGFSVEVLRGVFAAMGREASFEALPPNRGWMMIVRGERDGVYAGLRTSEREKICSFPDEPLARERWAMLVRAADVGKLSFSSFDDLIGHDVAVRGSLPGVFKQPAVSPELSKFLSEHHNMVETNGIDEALRMLAAGRVDYVVVNLSFGMNAVARVGFSGKIEPLLSHSAFEEGGYVCFTKGRVEPAFVDAFSRALKQFKQTEEFQAIYRKYFP